MRWLPTLCVVLIIVFVVVLSVRVVLDDQRFKAGRTTQQETFQGSMPGVYGDCEVCSMTPEPPGFNYGKQEEGSWDSPLASIPGGMAVSTPTAIPTPHPFQGSAWTPPKRYAGESVYTLSAWVVVAINGDLLTIIEAGPVSSSREKITILHDARIETTNEQGRETPFKKENIRPGMMILVQRIEYRYTVDLYTRYIWVYPRLWQ